MNQANFQSQKCLKKSCHTNEAETISKRLCLSNLKDMTITGIRVPRYFEWIDEKRVYPNKDHKIAGALVHWQLLMLIKALVK